MSIANLKYVPVASGTVTLNGATPVVVANANVKLTSQIELSLNTVGGNPPLSQPFVSALVAATSFSVRCIAASTENSIMNWVIFNPQV